MALWSRAGLGAHYGSDGRWLFVHAGRPSHWRGLWEAIGREELIDDPRFATPAARNAHRDELLEILKTEIRKRPAAEWDRIITDKGGAGGMVYTVEDVVNDPQAEVNGFWEHYDTPAGPRRLLAPPMQYSRTPLHPRGPAPDAGQHTDAVLAATGYSAEDIARLRAAGVI